ncbi:hypothetical protein SETIT_8G158700v2 [Setaria italica]|uniref:DUF4220 domain-containing protein n=1 Tax=Setaria italica TaxID=4555 RepID=A0A368S8F6_SETIT|nr:uncharacterized protein LOC101761199 [Setaria italica]RCV38634.1 hypothetical protein SETIT_8G158700v2 [Setaria italica]
MSSHFWRDVQWWEDWQLRFLVLASLAFQYFLFAAALLRKRRIPHWFRVLVWLAYQGGDIVAVYALATLFNRHKKDEVAAGTAHLDILWAPVLLLHLGGQDGITAYSIEDNENWRRHLLVAASQIAIAIYVFVKSWWFHDERLLRTSILLFVPGVIKCLEKPWALRNATVTSIANSSDPLMTMTMEEDDGSLPTDMKSLDEYVKAARKCVDDEAKRDPPQFFDDKMNDEPYHLFVDLAHPYSVRLKNLQVMAVPSGRAEAHNRVRAYVSRAFDRLYTKHKASYGGVLRAVVVLLTFADIGLFEVTRRRRGESSPYARADVVVTYVLLCCTAALELVSASVVLGSGLPETDDKAAQYNLIAYLARNRRRRWIRHLAFLLGIKDQLDWLWFTAPPQPTRRVTELVHDHVAGGWKPNGYIKSLDDYRRFNDSRGQRTLERERCGGTALAASLRMPFDESVLVWHLATELCYFDHVDTGGDATRHGRVISNYMAYLLFARPWMLIPGARRGLFRAVYIELREMLKEEPSELDDEEEEAAVAEKFSPTAMDEIARKIIQKLRNSPTSSDARPRARRLPADLVRKAWALAYELMEFATEKTKEFIKEEEQKPPPTEEEKRKAAAEEEKKQLTAEKKEAEQKPPPTEEEKRKAAAEEEKKQLTAEEKKEAEQKRKEVQANRAKKHGDARMWEVIQGVWVEMLCFSAGRCRGYLHGRSLGKGGEYLSYVWLLLSYMGMETMAERMQRTELGPVEGDAGALVKTSDPDDDDEEELAQLARPVAPRGATAAAAVAPAAMAVSVAAVVPVLGDDNV